MPRRSEASGGRFLGRPTGQEYRAFHNALLNRVYPKSERTSNLGTPVIIRTAQGNRDAGHIRTVGTNPVFVKIVNQSKHLHRKMDAWGIDTRVLDVLRVQDICRIRVVDSESGELYDTFLNVFTNSGIQRDFGYGAQTFLSRKYWYRGEPSRFGGQGVRYGE